MKKTLEEVFEEESQAHAEKERVLNEKIDAEIMQYIDNPVLGLQFKRPVITRPSNPSLFFIVSFFNLNQISLFLRPINLSSRQQSGFCLCQLISKRE